MAAGPGAGQDAGWDADRYQRQFGFVSALAGDLVDLLDPAPGETVLDLGCGTGELARRLAPAVAAITAVDLSERMIARGLLAATQPVTHAPWAIREDDLRSDAVRRSDSRPSTAERVQERRDRLFNRGRGEAISGSGSAAARPAPSAGCSPR